MTHTVGVRELKAKASEILLAVRNEKAEYTVTYRGKAIARLSPIGLPDLDNVAARSVEASNRWLLDEEESALVDELLQRHRANKKAQKLALMEEAVFDRGFQTDLDETMQAFEEIDSEVWMDE